MTNDSHTAPYDDSLLEEEWLAAPARRSRVRTALVLMLGAALMVFAGTQLQRHFGTSTSDSSTAFPGLPTGGAGGARPSGIPSGLPSGIPGGGQSGGQEGGSGVPTGGAGTGAGSAGSTSGSALIGTVVSVKGNRWTVKDLGGTTHVVHVSGSTQITRESRLRASGVRRGATVDISGASAAGSLNATTVVVR